MGWPNVIRLKYAKSAGRCQGIWLLLPMTRFLAIATIIEMRGLIAFVITNSNRNRRFDGGMRVVIFEGEVFKLECEQVKNGRVQMHDWRGARLA